MGKLAILFVALSAAFLAYRFLVNEESGEELVSNNQEAGSEINELQSTTPKKGAPTVQSDSEIVSTLRQPTFTEPDDASVNIQLPWFEDVFMAKRNSNTVVRHNFVGVVPANLRLELSRSLQAAQIHGETSEASTTLVLFPDTKYDIVVNQYRLSSVGYSNFGSALVEPTGDGREYFQFHISPEGEISGKGVARNRAYEYYSTPDPNLLVVVELDQQAINQHITIE